MNPSATLNQDNSALLVWSSRLTNIILVVLLAIFSARLIWHLFPVQPDLFLTISNTALPVKPAAPRSSAHSLAAQIGRTYPFGRIEVAPSPAPAAPIVTTPLNLTLKGIFASRDEPRAIISENGQADYVYGEGSPLPGNATLEKILSDRIILIRNGQRETLYLPKDTLDPSSSGSFNPGIPTPSGPSSYSPPSPPSSFTPPSQAAPSVTPGSFTAQPVLQPQRSGTTVDARELRAKIINDPASLSQFARISPAVENGHIAGYRVFPGAMQGQLAKYGLKPGDIITSINNIPLNGSRPISQIYNIVAKNSQVQVNLIRNGQRLTKQFQLR
ncbi:MAG: type II secretion system protein GspC [Gammaproteobacteria bacterium]|nr:MAG: type II secretion system protein GspC [Gammaproteobacteria bacterium]